MAWRLVDAALEDRELAMRRKLPISPGEMRGLRGFIVRRALEAFGPGGARVLTRLTAFLLLCIGVQIVLTGVQEAVAPLQPPRS